MTGRRALRTAERWTESALSAIAFGEAEVDREGLVPANLSGDCRAGWRAGYARGRSCLGYSTEYEVPHSGKGRAPGPPGRIVLEPRPSFRAEWRSHLQEEIGASG